MALSLPHDMHPLYQRLKELDSDTFEKLCFHLLKERHPTAGIRHVDGAGGDQGIDIFAGDLDEAPVVWQCKSFSNGIGNSQREKIRQSLRQAVKHTKLRRWILCLSIDMDAKGHRWFARLQASYADRVAIGLMQAGDIVHELLHRASLRNLFFPQAVIDTMELRSILAKTGDLTDEELAAVSTENVELYVARLKARDARFNYEVVFAPDDGPIAAHPTTPGLLLSVSDGSKMINVLARDSEALRADPLTATFTVKGGGVEKLQNFIRTGRSQQLEAGEITQFKSNCALLCPTAAQDSADIRLFMHQNIETLEPVPARLTFGHGSEAVIYEYIPLHVVRVGSAEIELRSSGDYPFELRLSADDHLLQTGNINFQYKFGGYNIRAIQKFLRAIDALATGGRVELYDLQNGKHLIRATATAHSEEWIDPAMVRLIDDGMRVADHYGVELHFPEHPEQDYAKLAWLSGLIGGVELPIDTVTLSVTKLSEAQVDLQARLAFRLVQPGVSLDLFGKPVSSGELCWLIEDARLHDSTMADRLREASVGETIELLLDVCGPTRVVAAGVHDHGEEA